MNLAERALLEVEFCNKFHAAIDQLIRNDFPEQDVKDFIRSVKTFLTFPDIKEYVRTALYEKAKEVSQIFLVIDRGLYYSYKKFISILISLDDPDVIEMLETNFAKEKKLNNFFLLIEEKLNQNKDISNCENLFLSLMTLHHFEIDSIDEFLSAIRKDRQYLIQKLIENQSYSTLRKYIDELAKTNKEFLTPLVPVIIEKYHDRIGAHYLDLVRVIVSYSTDFTDKLLTTRNLRMVFQKHILENYSDWHDLIQNYALYLLSKDEVLFVRFEKAFLMVASSSSICSFALNIPFSSKRLILQRLVELKDEEGEDYLVDFIKRFPEYQNLLPLL